MSGVADLIDKKSKLESKIRTELVFVTVLGKRTNRKENAEIISDTKRSLIDNNLKKIEISKRNLKLYNEQLIIVMKEIQDKILFFQENRDKL